MKKTLLNIYRRIVGREYGWSGKGNTQWYYFLALVINCMLTWQFKPEFWGVFIVFAIIHFITVCAYGYAMLSYTSLWDSLAYYAIHASILIVCLLMNFGWTIFTALMVICAFMIAPDIENIFFMKVFKEIFIYYGDTNPLIFHTILFSCFVVIALNLNISLWIRIMIIVACMFLHPIIDFLDGKGISIYDVTNESLKKIVQTVKDKKEKK